METEQKKKCFIITPIGGESDPIRRHIEGVIEAAIRPALEDKYKLIVAHKIYEPGSITKQVISEIYNAKLVIANLTDRNPNVMYELAFRHSLGKPVIMIAESGTTLPADIIMERTIFYRNDAQGTLELKKALEKAESEIDFSIIGSPIHDVLHSIDRDNRILQLSQNDSKTEQDVLPYIVEKLNRLEDIVLANKTSNTIASPFSDRTVRFTLSNVPEDADERKIFMKELHNAFRFLPIHMFTMRIIQSEKEFATFIIQFQAPEDFSDFLVRGLIQETLAESGYTIIAEPEILKRVKW